MKFSVPPFFKEKNNWQHRERGDYIFGIETVSINKFDRYSNIGLYDFPVILNFFQILALGSPPRGHGTKKENLGDRWWGWIDLSFSPVYIKIYP